MIYEGTLRYIMIDHDRYGGGYSGGRYTAWVGDVPTEANGQDMACGLFWKNNKRTYGKGSTQDDALFDLLTKIKQENGSLGFDLIISNRTYDKPHPCWKERFNKCFYPYTDPRIAVEFPKSAKLIELLQECVHD